jgi:hypothetical protein
MRFRKLRIAWSVLWGVLAVLLCVLWVRSYAHSDLVDVPFGSSKSFRITIDPGMIWTAKIDMPSEWNFESEPVSRKHELLASIYRHGFAFSGADSEFAIALPFWLYVIFSILVGSLSWIPRFSLRTLLIATTLLALIMGLVVYFAN